MDNSVDNRVNKRSNKKRSMISEGKVLDPQRLNPQRFELNDSEIDVHHVTILGEPQYIHLVDWNGFLT